MIIASEKLPGGWVRDGAHTAATGGGVTGGGVTGGGVTGGAVGDGLGVGVGVNVGVGDGLNIGVGEGVTVGVTLGISEGAGVSLGAAETCACTKFSVWLSTGTGSTSTGIDSLETFATIWTLYVPTAAHSIVYCTLVVPAPKLEMLTTDIWICPEIAGN